MPWRMSCLTDEWDSVAWSRAASVITKGRYSFRGLTGENVSLNTESSVVELS